VASFFNLITSKGDQMSSDNSGIAIELLDNSPDAMMALSPSGVVVYWNKGAEQTFGYSKNEAVGRRLGELIIPADRLAEEQQFTNEVMVSGHSGFESLRRKKDGELIEVEILMRLIRDNEGRVKYILSSKRNITERKLAEEALRSSEIRYRRLFESARDGVLILDGTSGEIVDVNPYLTEMLCYSKQELQGKELWEIGTFKDIAASKEAFLELQAKGYVRYDDLPLQSRNGKITHVEVVANGYIEAEHRVVQCNIRDITERKLNEETLQQTNKQLEKALAELHAKTQELASMTQQLWQASKLATMGELSASVAHELNNPLATISLHTELLAGSLARDDPSRRHLLVIEKEVARMATLVSNLLLFSRRGHPEFSTLDLCEELTNTLDFIQYHLRSHNVEIIKDCATDLPTVQADRQQLRQVFLNLIANAGDAMANGGTLTVKSSAGIMASGQQAVVVDFSDTGAGVNTGDLPKLWEPFFTTKPEGKGTGLGLAICRRIVEAHRGTIEIETGPGKGTTVHITLPATEQQREVAA
jgi:PAS domain S-box-containing protein